LIQKLMAEDKIDEWEGSADELRSRLLALTWPHNDDARKLLQFNVAAGRYLSRLAKQGEGSISKGGRIRNTRIWKIKIS
jgi:hypothetical protein